MYLCRSVEKDVDGERPKSLASDGIYYLLGDSAALPAESRDGVLPCTVAAVLELIDSYQYSNTLEGIECSVVVPCVLTCAYVYICACLRMRMRVCMFASVCVYSM